MTSADLRGANKLALGGAILRVVLLYAVFASLWIFGSDGVLGLLIQDAQTLAQASMLKGWVFVAITSLLLYFAMRRWLGMREPQRPGLVRPAARAPGIMNCALLLYLL